MLVNRKGERYLSAELKCYSCGHVAGHIQGPIEAPLRRGRIRRIGDREDAWRRITPDHMKCSRCAGRVLLDDVEYNHARPGAIMPWHRPLRQNREPKIGSESAA